MKPYLPSNGTEGEIFISKWCEKCTKDTSLRNGSKFCIILTKTMMEGNVKQWIYNDKNEPICTAFKSIETLKKKKYEKYKKEPKLF